MSANQTVLPFLLQLKEIDKAKLTCRDMLILWAVSKTPGAMGIDISNKLGFDSRSAVQLGIARLIKRGMIEDRRVEKEQKIPNRLYITAQGTEFFKKLTE